MALIPITRDGGGTLEHVDESLLEKREGMLDNDHEHTTWVEYWLDGTLVHRSAHVTLKEWPPGLSGVIGDFG